MADADIYRMARKRVRQKRKFYTHFMSWLVMSVFFILLNLFTADFFWAIFPILGWGVAIAFHAIKVFSFTYGDDWEQREIEKEITKIKSREGAYAQEEFSSKEEFV